MVKVTRSKNVSNGDFNGFSMGCLSGERYWLLDDGPATDVMKEYDCGAYDAGCAQSVCVFLRVTSNKRDKHL